jgi:hypothetical protein
MKPHRKGLGVEILSSSCKLEDRKGMNAFLNRSFPMRVLSLFAVAAAATLVSSPILAERVNPAASLAIAPLTPSARSGVKTHRDSDFLGFGLIFVLLGATAATASGIATMTHNGRSPGTPASP